MGQNFSWLWFVSHWIQNYSIVLLNRRRSCWICINDHAWHWLQTFELEWYFFESMLNHCFLIYHNRSCLCITAYASSAISHPCVLWLIMTRSDCAWLFQLEMDQNRNSRKIVINHNYIERSGNSCFHYGPHRTSYKISKCSTFQSSIHDGS